MTNHPTVANDAAYPTPENQFGLTKRELFAAKNNAEILGRYYELPPETRLKQATDWQKVYGDVRVVDAIAMDAVKSADALISALNNPQTT